MPNSLQAISAGTAHLPLERFTTSSQLSEPEKIAELSRKFEAVLLRQILQQSQKTMFPSDWVQESAIKEIYRDMIAYQLAEQISDPRAGGIGVAQSLQAELTRQVTDHSEE